MHTWTHYIRTHRRKTINFSTISIAMQCLLEWERDEEGQSPIVIQGGKSLFAHCTRYPRKPQRRRTICNGCSFNWLYFVVFLDHLTIQFQYSRCIPTCRMQNKCRSTTTTTTAEMIIIIKKIYQPHTTTHSVAFLSLFFFLFGSNEQSK